MLQDMIQRLGRKDGPGGLGRSPSSGTGHGDQAHLQEQAPQNMREPGVGVTVGPGWGTWKAVPVLGVGAAGGGGRCGWWRAVQLWAQLLLAWRTLAGDDPTPPSPLPLPRPAEEKVQVSLVQDLGPEEQKQSPGVSAGRHNRTLQGAWPRPGLLCLPPWGLPGPNKETDKAASLCAFPVGTGTAFQLCAQCGSALWPWAGAGPLWVWSGFTRSV